MVCNIWQGIQLNSNLFVSFMCDAKHRLGGGKCFQNHQFIPKWSQGFYIFTPHQPPRTFYGLQICSPKITHSPIYWTFSWKFFSGTSYSSISYNPLDLTLNLDIFRTSGSVTTNHQPPPCPLTYRHSDLVTSNHPLPHILNWNFS